MPVDIIILIIIGIMASSSISKQDYLKYVVNYFHWSGFRYAYSFFLKDTLGKRKIENYKLISK